MTAVANLDQLFPIAVRDLSRPDRDGDPNIKAWHHFSVPIPFRGELLRAKILAKELVSPGQGTRLYVVQAVEIETEPASYGMDATSPDQPTAPISTPPTGSENQFSTLLDAVKQGKVFEGFGAPGESQGEPKAPLSLPSLAELRERGLNPARAVANAAKYWPAGGKPAEDTIGVTDMGREYLQRVERAWWGSKRLAAGWMSPLNDARRGLSRADRKYIRTAFLRDYEEGGVDRAWPSEAVAGFARAWRDTNERISDEAGELVPTFAGRDPDTYVPHRLTDVGRAIMTKQAGPEWDALVEAAQVNGIDVHVLMGLRQDALRQSRYGSIDYARVADLPWEVTTEDGRTVRILESDPEVLFSHVRSAARRLSTIREFETDEATEQYHDALAAGLIAEGRLDTEAAAVTKDALQRIWKRLEGQDSIEIKTRWRRALWQSLDSVTAALNLSGAVIGNLVGGPLPQMIRMGGAQTMKDFAAAYTTAIKDGSLAEVRALVDLEGDLLHELATTETLEGKVAKGAGKFLGATGFIAVNRKINQAVAAAMIKRQLQAMVEQAGSGNQAGKLWGKDAAAARRYLVDELKFSDEDVERMILDGVTDEDKARAAGKQLELVNAMNEAPGGRPANIAHPLWRLAFAYSTYARKMFDTSKFVAREARAGNVRPLATMIFAGAPTAALIAAIKNFLKDREEEDKGYLERLLVGMTEIGALGLAGSWRYGIMRMDDPRADLWTDLTKPPHVEVVTSLLEGIGKAGAQGELRPLWKGVTGVASGLDILDKQATRRGFLPSPRVIQDEDTGLEVNATRRQREYAERLVDQVYVRRTTRNGVVREPLDPILSKFRPATTRRLIADLRADGLSDEQILTLIEDARARRAREK